MTEHGTEHGDEERAFARAVFGEKPDDEPGTDADDQPARIPGHVPFEGNNPEAPDDDERAAVRALFDN